MRYVAKSTLQSTLVLGPTDHTMTVSYCVVHLRKLISDRFIAELNTVGLER